MRVVLHSDANDRSLSFLFSLVCLTVALGLLRVVLNDLPPVFPGLTYEPLPILSFIPARALTAFIDVGGVRILAIAGILFFVLSLTIARFKMFFVAVGFLISVGVELTVRGFAGHMYHGNYLPFMLLGFLIPTFFLERRNPEPTCIFRALTGLLCFSYITVGVARVCKGDPTLFLLPIVRGEILQQVAADDVLFGVEAACRLPDTIAVLSFALVTVAELLLVLPLVDARASKPLALFFVGFHVLSVLLLDVWFPENVILIFCLLTGSWFHGAVGYFDAWRSRQKGVR